MLSRLLAQWRRRREQQVLRRRAIPDALWQQTLQQWPFLAWRDEADLAELRRLSSLFLDGKEFSAAGGLQLDDAMAVAIAAQACLPVLRLGLQGYGRFVGIVVHPDEVWVPRERMDDDGVVHDQSQGLIGEAVDGGPVMLSWRHVQHGAQVGPWVCNVVIHEFVHVLDMADGQADGMPVIADSHEREAWRDALITSHARFCRRVDAGRPTLLDPYAASAPEEFFAVAAEAFFVSPWALRDEHPAMYRVMARHFQQDPAGWPVQAPVRAPHGAARWAPRRPTPPARPPRLP